MAEHTTVSLPVDEVVLLEDRAHVLRRAALTLPAGRSRLRVEDVTPVLADRTLCAAVESGGGARVADVRLRRHPRAITEALPEKVRALERELEALQERVDERHGALRRLQLQEAGLSSLADSALEDVAVDAAWEQLDAGAWRAELAHLAEEERGVRDRRLALEHEIADLQRELGDLQTRIMATTSGADRIAGTLELEVIADEAGEVAVRIDYLVPCACWRPYHRATLDRTGEGATVTFATDACVWQNTGEDWAGATLVFSTERPSLGTEPPELSSDVLAVQRRREVLEVETREQEIQTTGLGGEARSTAPELPGIDDGGEVLSLPAPARADVPADGRPHRIPLSSFTTGCDVELVTFPELAAATLTRSEQLNGAPSPILAGPVDLVRDGGFVGRTSVKFIAPKERFDLGWGPDGALRVRREVEQSAQDKGMLSSWIKQDTTVTVRLTNLGDEPRKLVVRERIPVSEIEKVQIEVDTKETTGAVRPDDDGVLEWSVDLEAYGRKKVELVYEIKKHSDIAGI